MRGEHSIVGFSVDNELSVDDGLSVDGGLSVDDGFLLLLNLKYLIANLYCC